MKKFLLVAMLFVAGLSMAQEMPKIPVDPAVRIGKLDNGLTSATTTGRKTKQTSTLPSV